MARVDIAIPCYNYGEFLADAVASVLSQGVEDIRILIIDNASSDASAAIAHSLADRNPRVELIVNSENRGYHHSYNRAIDWATAEYFVLLDADDMLAPGSLRRGMAILQSNQTASFAYGIEGILVDGCVKPARRVAASPRVKVTAGREYIRNNCQSPFCDVDAPTVIRRTAAQKNAGHYDNRLVRTCDLEMYLRLAHVGDVASIDRIQAIRRVHPRQHSQSYCKNPVSDLVEIEAAFESFFNGPGAAIGDAAELLAIARRKIDHHAYWSALAQLTRGNRDGARATFQFAKARRGRSASLPPISFLLQKRYVSRAADLAFTFGARRSVPLDQWLLAARTDTK